MPPNPTRMFMLYDSVHSKERLQTRLQTNCQSIHSNITSPYWWESKSVSKGCGKWENWKLRKDLAKNIMATSLKVRCKTLCRSNAAACNATILVCAKSIFKKGSCVHLPYSAYWGRLIPGGFLERLDTNFRFALGGLRTRWIIDYSVSMKVLLESQENNGTPRNQTLFSLYHKSSCKGKK